MARHNPEQPDLLGYLGNDVNARQLFKDANSFVAIIFSMLDDEHREALTNTNPHLWHIQRISGWRNDRAVWHFGFVLALQELAKHPDVLQFAVQDFYHRVAEYLPPPFTVIEDFDQEAKRKVSELISRLLEKE